ncbi:MAG: xylulose kinase, partial [Deltaproteobacteria bacterium]|nr:xylulose kinase [Deltaproteobacteria bacterium]
QYTEKFIGRKMSPIRIVGGGAKSDLWCQIFADVMQREIRQVSGPIHANARGAAFIALVGLGKISFDDIPDLVQYEQTFSPIAKNVTIYNELFKAFIRLYKANRPIYQSLNRV